MVAIDDQLAPAERVELVDARLELVERNEDRARSAT